MDYRESIIFACMNGATVYNKGFLAWLRPVINRLRLVLAFLSFVLMVSCRGELVSILPSDVDLQPGDLVFRCGISVESAAVLLAEGDAEYSHVGIVVWADGEMKIVHAVPSEPDFPGDVDRVKCDAPSLFFRSDRAGTGEIKRHKNGALARAAADRALGYYQRHVLFDHDYNDRDSTAVYCSELVVRAYREAGLPLIEVRSQAVGMPGFRYGCILPSALLRCRDFYRVNKF